MYKCKFNFYKKKFPHFKFFKLQKASRPNETVCLRVVLYRIVLVFSRLLLWLSCNRRGLGLIPGDLQNTTFELSSLIGCLKNKQKKKERLAELEIKACMDEM